MVTRKVAALLAMLSGSLLATPAVAVAPCAGSYAATLDPATDRTVARPAANTGTGTGKVDAKLELKTDGSFTYELHRDGPDEGAKGKWRTHDDRVILSGDPVTAPAFTLAADRETAEPRLRIELDLPNGLSRQYFFAAVRLADGTTVARGFTGEPFELVTDPRNPPVALRVNLPVFTLSSEELALKPGAGHDVQVRFAANDLGRIAFAETPLIERDGALMLERDGGALAFRRQGRCTPQ